MRLKSLRAALAPLTKFGQDETSFEVNTSEGGQVRVYLRPLVPKEEIECQKRAREILKQVQEEEGEGDENISRAAAIQYFDMFRIEVVSYSLVQVGSQDFRGVKHIETEETLPNGNTVKVPLNKALRDLISEEWSRSMITICWTKYGELMTKIAQKAEKVVEQNLADMDAEILRLTEKLTKLKFEREQRAKGDPSVTMDQIKAITNLGNALEEEIDETIQRAQQERELQAKLREEAENYDKKNPKGFAATLDQEGEVYQNPIPVRQPVIPPVVPPPTSKGPPQGASFVSSFEEPDSTEALLQQEEAAMRIMEARNAAKGQRTQEMGRELSRAEHIGQVPSSSGKMVDAYRLPPETISSRGENSRNQKADSPGKGNYNPNFIPSKKP